MGSRDIDKAIGAIARRQHDVVAAHQLRAAGISDKARKHRLRCGLLRPLYRGVYVVGHGKLSSDGRFIAAVLAAGEGAVLSHRSAIEHWGMLPPKRGAIHVSVVNGHQREGLRLHRTKLVRDEVTSLRGIAVTTVPRSLLDFATAASSPELESAINEAKLRKLPRFAQLNRFLERHAGHPGSAKLRAALDGRPTGFTRSPLERRFVAFLKRANLPLPELNQRMELDGLWIEADCVWREQRLIVELDGTSTHSSPAAFEADRARDRRLTASGWRPVRVTSLQLDEPSLLERDLRGLLDVA